MWNSSIILLFLVTQEVIFVSYIYICHSEGGVAILKMNLWFCCQELPGTERHDCWSTPLCLAMIPKALGHFISIIVVLWLQDIWQLLHPTGKSYSCFSSIHHCHRRIDFSLLCYNLSQFILDCSMWNILISYHTSHSACNHFLKTCH